LKINEFTNLRHIQRGSFRFLPNLEQLTMKNNSISSIEPRTFDSLKQIREFDLAANQLEKFPSIENLLNLDTLKLSQNKISRIAEPGKTRQVNTKLRVLELNNGELAEVGPEVFSGFSNLKDLKLRSNSIATLSSESLSGLSNIESIELSGNPFERICDDLFADMGKMRYIQLRNLRALNVIDENAFGDPKTRFHKIVVDIEADADQSKWLLKPFARKGLITIQAFGM
jgi:hypothetical protein